MEGVGSIAQIALEGFLHEASNESAPFINGHPGPARLPAEAFVKAEIGHLLACLARRPKTLSDVPQIGTLRYGVRVRRVR